MNAVEIEQAITDLAEQPFDHSGRFIPGAGVATVSVADTGGHLAGLQFPAALVVRELAGALRAAQYPIEIHHHLSLVCAKPLLSALCLAA